LRFGEPQPFSFEALTERAARLAAQPYQEPVIQFPQLLGRIDYDAFQDIRFRPEMAIWRDGPGAFPVQLFHLGRFFQQPVRVHVVEDGTAREVLYDPALFTFGPKASFVRDLPPDLGFAGFRVMGQGDTPDWLAFLGASYFRSSGELGQYGLSARGLAIGTAMPQPEEFPRFSAFWLAPAPAGEDAILIAALLEGPSVAGAYRMKAVKRGAVVTEVEARLFARTAIERMGVAPLTAMYWYSETNRHVAADWRPEIHDCDGLAMWTGAGERLWRPLNDPPVVMTNSFLDRSPRGFGLLQRDRAFPNYEDDGVFYDRRPSVWVEPLHDWGEGAVQLVEIPTGDEIDDNIVAYWVPAKAVAAGTSWEFRYRLHWAADEPYPTPLGRVWSTRTGRGGIPGQPRPEGVKKLAVDFAGGPLEGLGREDGVEPVVTASRGTLSNPYALPVVGTKRWRAVFDLQAEGAAPVDLRLYLRRGGQALTETWLYQYIPFEFPGLAGSREPAD
jgi:glucans biosynthesis protein